MKNSIIYYSVGALLYCPADSTYIAKSVIDGSLGDKFSLAFCLEDTINDNFVSEAENILVKSINEIYNSRQERDFYLPKMFIRIRDPEQITRLTEMLGSSAEIVTGFIIPKFSTLNAKAYINTIAEINEKSPRTIYFMPIYESAELIDLRKRADVLYSLKDALAEAEELVLNIRVGGNDLCHLFGFRRSFNESIHRIRPIADIFSDIVAVYGTDYIISGPVWEYYSGEYWRKGLEAEIEDDMLSGFTGKTVIHPNQIAPVNEAYKVISSDYNDANRILRWDRDNGSYVSGNYTGERMNEYKTHTAWAEKTLFLAEAYGVKE